MSKDNKAPHKMFNLKMLSELTGMPYMKIRNNFEGVYNSLTEEEKQSIIDHIEDCKDKLF